MVGRRAQRVDYFRQCFERRMYCTSFTTHASLLPPLFTHNIIQNSSARLGSRLF